MPNLWGDVLCDVADNDIPDYLKQRFEAEKTEETRKKKEKSEAHLYTELSVGRFLKFWK